MFGNRTLRRIIRVRKRPPEDRLENVEREALPLQLSGDALRPAELQGEPLRTLPFRGECGDRALDRLGRGALRLEQVPNRLVPEAAAGERVGAGRRVPGVVHVADALERVERVGPFVVFDSRALEAIVDLAPGAIAMAERPRGEIDRVGLPRR
jgi:hypothetical protein